MDALGGLLIPKSTHLGLFFAPDSSFKAVAFANDVSAKLSDIFRVEPNVVSLPLKDVPPGIPKSLPRVFWEEKGVGSVAVAYSRADLMLDWRDDSEWRGRAITSAADLASCCVDKYGLKVVWMGFVLKGTLTPSVLMKDVLSRYTNSKALQDAVELNLAWLRHVPDDAVPVERWVRLSCSTEDGEAIKVAVDTKTIEKEGQSLTADSVKHYVETWMDQIWSDVGYVISWNVGE